MTIEFGFDTAEAFKFSRKWEFPSRSWTRHSHQKIMLLVGFIKYHVAALGRNIWVFEIHGEFYVQSLASVQRRRVKGGMILYVVREKEFFGRDMMRMTMPASAQSEELEV